MAYNPDSQGHNAVRAHLAQARITPAKAFNLGPIPQERKGLADMTHYYEENDLERFNEIGKYRPDLYDNFMNYYQGVMSAGALSVREKALIALAVAHAVQCPYCIDAYTRGSLEAGSNLEEMTEAIHVATAIRGGATLIHGIQAANAAAKIIL